MAMSEFRHTTTILHLVICMIGIPFFHCTLSTDACCPGKVNVFVENHWLP